MNLGPLPERFVNRRTVNRLATENYEFGVDQLSYGFSDIAPATPRRIGELIVAYGTVAEKMRGLRNASCYFLCRARPSNAPCSGFKMLR
ncbi:hypothetical protein [Bradyrhizobium ottawaense]|uniref:hypothetical protein n=1 Tax=Bradyrhizobium ottawaense TaxID=931866 RepID=UPI001178BD1A|nr:hypothetical protein [Bradyrhizobium ottawaense]